ncbi:MAG: winged helix-turn-helix transcriptional regulator [Thermoplasmatota archaeon]
MGDVRSHQGDCQSGGCRMDALFGLLSRAHLLDVLYIFNHTDGTVRFKDLEAKLDISPNTLTNRLKDLTEAGFITRTAHATIPPRVDYEATPKARELRHVFMALHDWAQRHDLEPVPLPTP